MRSLRSKYGTIAALVYAVAALINLFSVFPCGGYFSFCSLNLLLITPPAFLIFGGKGIDFSHASPVTSDTVWIAICVGICAILFYFIATLAETTPIRRNARVLLIVGATGCGSLQIISSIARKYSFITAATFGIVVGLWVVLTVVLLISIQSKWEHFVESKTSDAQLDKGEIEKEGNSTEA